MKSGLLWIFFQFPYSQSEVENVVLTIKNGKKEEWQGRKKGGREGGKKL